MALVECGNGHLFDNAMYQYCPYCGNNNSMINFGVSEDVGVTAPVQGYQSYQPEAPQMAPQPVPQPAPAPAPAPQAPQQVGSDIGKTVGLFQKKMNFEPVVGWLVCIEGPEKGKDFRILGRTNLVGRSEKMDICLKNDATISRESHAKVAYDEKHNAFHVIPGDSTNIAYLNDEPVYVPLELKKGDILEFGECKLVFIPFCDDKFTWKED